jgi:hypothetical protein
MGLFAPAAPASRAIPFIRTFTCVVRSRTVIVSLSDTPTTFASNGSWRGLRSLARTEL